MRLGIYGGTFAPVHNGHVRAAEIFLRECELDRLMIIPAGIPPHKEINADDSPVQRLEMCELAFSHLPKTEINDLELRRVGKSYTVMTVRDLEKEGRDIFLLCGTDMMLTFDKWFCFEEIMSKCTLVYIRREDDSAIGTELERKVVLYREKYGAKIKRLDAPAMELSSTDVREAVREGRDISEMVPKCIDKYIKDHKMYEKNEI